MIHVNKQSRSNEFDLLRCGADKIVKIKSIMDKEKSRVQFEKVEPQRLSPVETMQLRQNQYEQEENLAAELKNIRRKEICDMKMRQLIRENSHELRELERQLKQAYSFKGLCTQLKEKEAMKIEEKLREIKVQELLAKAGSDADVREWRAEQEEREKKEMFRIKLQDQMIEKERKHQEAFVEEMNERQKLNNIMKEIKQNEELEQEKVVEKQKKLKEEMEATFKAKNTWKEKERLAIEEENEKLKEYQEMMQKQTEKEKQEKEQQRKTRDLMVEKMCQELQQQRETMREREELIQRLVCAEQEEQHLRRVKEEEEREEQKKVENKMVLLRMAEEKAERMRQEKIYEKLLLDKMMEELEKKNKLEQLGEEKRRQKKLILRREALELISLNRERQAEELLMVQHSNKLYADEIKHQEDLIEEERMKLLKQHVDQLVGYIKPGVLTDNDYHNLNIETLLNSFL